MKISNRRIALLTGASVAVLGYGAPAYAATTVQPGTCSTAPAGPDATDTLDITLLGDTGVTSVNNPAVAVVKGCQNGEVIQGVAAGAGNVSLTIENGAAGDVNIAAVATASNTTGDATAMASIVGAGVDQLGNGTGDLDLAIDNAGSLAVQALANATADGIAHATVNFTGSSGFPYGYGIYQSALGVGGADSIVAAINNDADASISVAASANAAGATATANVNADWGIWQIGINASTVDVDLNNAGTINIDSLANATGTAGAAHANAGLIGGIVQVAIDGTTVAANIDNAGTIAIDVAAGAKAEATAVANATLTYGIAQSVGGTTSLGGFAGSGLASLTNDGSIAIDVAANATGSVASAHAALGGTGTTSGGIVQVVNALTGDTGSAVIANNGTIDIAASANASATGTAIAGATVGAAVVQNVTGRLRGPHITLTTADREYSGHVSGDRIEGT